MANKFTCLLFGLLLVVPAYYSAPTDSSEEVSIEGSLKAFVERLKLVALLLEETLQLSIEVTDKGPKLIEAVLKDPKVLEVKNDAMDANIKEMRSFLKQFDGMKESEKKDKVFESFESLSNIFQKYDSDKQESLSPEEKIIQKSLEENGMTELEKNVLKHLESFVKKFNAEVEEYIGGLTEKEKKSEKEFIDWFETFKAEEDAQKKIEKFSNFFDDDED